MLLLCFWMDASICLGAPKEFICENASIINSEFFKDLFAMSGVEQHRSVAYRPQSNRRAEQAV